MAHLLAVDGAGPGECVAPLSRGPSRRSWRSWRSQDRRRPPIDPAARRPGSGSWWPMPRRSPLSPRGPVVAVGRVRPAVIDVERPAVGPNRHPDRPVLAPDDIAYHDTSGRTGVPKGRAVTLPQRHAAAGVTGRRPARAGVVSAILLAFDASVWEIFGALSRGGGGGGARVGGGHRMTSTTCRRRTSQRAHRDRRGGGVLSPRGLDRRGVGGGRPGRAEPGGGSAWRPAGDDQRHGPTRRRWRGDRARANGGRRAVPIGGVAGWCCRVEVVAVVRWGGW